MCVTSLLSQIQSNVLQRIALLLSKLHGVWFNELDGRGMLSVNHSENKLHIPDRKDANPFTEQIANTKGFEV